MTKPLNRQVSDHLEKYFIDMVQKVPMTKPITEEQVVRFEYLVKNHTSWIDAETDRFNGDWFQDRLDKFGKKGWELCAVDDIHVYFKRELRASIKKLGENK